MTIKTETVGPQEILELAQSLPHTDLRWLVDELSQILDDEPLPESITLDGAIALFLEGKCSLGRAAELAGVTRWYIQDVLYERGTPASLGSDLTLKEIDEMVDMVEAKYGRRK